MSYRTIEVITCDKCGVRHPFEIEVQFSIATSSQRESMTRAAVEAGWTYRPPSTQFHIVTYAEHYCPAHNPAGKRRTKRPS
jgi:hypothetical protein